MGRKPLRSGSPPSGGFEIGCAPSPGWDPARKELREDFGRAGASESALSERRPETPRLAEVHCMVGLNYRAAAI